MPFLKAALAVVVSIIGAAVVALGTTSTGDIGDVSGQSWLVAALAVVGSGGIVWWTENGPAAPAIKAIMALLSAGIASLVVALDDHLISQAEWLTAISAAVLASGLVYQATNSDGGE